MMVFACWWACAEPPVDFGPAPPWPSEDLDFDGWPVDEDCDDRDPSAYPGAEEIWYSGIDEACDGGDDFDFDGDGYPLGEATAFMDALPDCDDENAAVHPGVAAICGNGIDDDCDTREDCARQGVWWTTDFPGARLIGAGYPEGAGDLDGDGVAEWFITESVELVLVAAFTSGTRLRDDVTIGSIQSSILRVGNVGGIDGEDLVVEAPFPDEIVVYLDPERDRVPDATIDSNFEGLAVGDVTGDSVGDVVLGTALAGVALVFAGPLAGDLTPDDAVATLSSYDASDVSPISQVGQVMDARGDLTGDGLADLVASTGGSYQARAAIFPGPVVGFQSAWDVHGVGAEGDGFSDGLPHNHDSQVDWNQDGYDDLFLNDVGVGLIFFGPILEDRAIDAADATIGGVSLRSWTWPNYPAACGDVNGDGWPDVSMISDPGFLMGPGSATFAYGPFEGQFPDWLGVDLIVKSPYGDVTSLVAVGDADGDGADDVLVGVYDYDAAVGTNELILGAVGFGF